MAHRSVLFRRAAALVGWVAVTAVGATGSWWGMTAVFTADSARSEADTVLTESDDQPSPEADAQGADDPGDDTGERSETDTISAPTPPPDDDPASTTPPEDHGGWMLVDVDTYECSFQTAGGTAVVRLEPDRATLVSASPATGFTAATEQPASGRLVVSFVGSGSAVIIDAMWWNGRPHGLVSSV
ncbi:hypothetical protein [Stackebrandtia albiflava]|nr:hypothetical protein [Stackebrandtia albiflava]